VAELGRVAVYIPARLRRQGSLQLNQQCWVWGQDVRRAEGNLLLESGFVRRRAEDGSLASSQYTLEVRAGMCLRLWGYGLYFGEIQGSGIYLNRFEFLPRVAVSDGERWHGVGEFTELALAADTVLLGEAIRAIANYERWVLSTFGVAYRRACLAGWSKRQLDPVASPVEWETLAHRLESLRCKQAADVPS
jgi:hypothetical protein